ncbi:TetR/AcrR family transcriptional regulator [Mycobacterium malmoense]|uniref:TetR/AcrR family transcriptional regulator n=1 Tax=Mycobacterium malmoense TaxID=1780 RepID=UPI0008F8086A|nr:TetR family transcriptional regulator [Mycobacterium malmoense]
MKNKRRGRGRPARHAGQPDTRTQILDAARAQFIEVGYRAATVRAIAAQAGVDPALINYFFGSKQRLFGEALALRANPVEIIAGQIDGPLDELPRRLLTVLLETWDQPENRPTLLAIAQAGAGPDSSALTRGFVEEALAAPITERLQHEGVPPDDARLCTALLITQLVGVIYARYVLAVDPVAAIPRHAFIDRFTPALNAAVRSCLGQRQSSG